MGSVKRGGGGVCVVWNHLNRKLLILLLANTNLLSVSKFSQNFETELNSEAEHISKIMNKAISQKKKKTWMTTMIKNTQVPLMSKHTYKQVFPCKA